MRARRYRIVGTGIDIGDVDLICRIRESVRRAAFLQRVGEAVTMCVGLPKADCSPLSRDELVESAGLLDAVRHCELDAIIMPGSRSTSLPSRCVAEGCRAGDADDELFAVMLGAYPFRQLERKTYDDVVKMLADGFTTQQGKRGAHIHRDIITRQAACEGRPAIRVLNGGAIPTCSIYDVDRRTENDVRRYVERGLRDREHAGRRVPARQQLAWRIPWRGRKQGAGGGTRSEAALAALLAQ